LNVQFAPAATTSPAKKKPAGNFNDAWSYLNMDQYLSKEGKAKKLACEKFMDEINPTVS
jgi:hypothetical protein